MALKMKELMLRSGESKSTILYYLKEGLLPEPQKPKPNVHLYDESCIERIRFIKYLQEHFGYSIAEIKAILEHNRFDGEGSFEAMLQALEIISSAGTNRYDKEDFLELSGLDERTLHRYVTDGLLFDRGGYFTDKELEIVAIIRQAEAMGLDRSLLDAYVHCAKNLADKEFETGAAMMRTDPDRHTEHYALFFDLILKLKPYVFHMHTVAAYRKHYQTDQEEA